MGWLLHCNTGSLRKHETSVPCYVLLSNNYVRVKKNIVVHSEKSVYKFGVFLCSLAKMSAKCSDFATRCCYIHPPLIFATLSINLIKQKNLLLTQISSTVDPHEQADLRKLLVPISER